MAALTDASVKVHLASKIAKWNYSKRFFLCKSDVTEPSKLPKSQNHTEVTQAMFTLRADDTDKASVRKPSWLGHMSSSRRSK